jgi:hypothetical protein
MLDEALVDLTADVTRVAIRDLFERHPDEEFYYVTLISTGTIPFLSAWSKQALERAAKGLPERMDLLKWSYADSPYCGYRSDDFDKLHRCFDEKRRDLDFLDYFELTLNVAEAVMHRLDLEGIFGTGPARERIFVGAEVMPPDYTNTQRARRLNPPAALAEWLAEIAEPDDAPEREQLALLSAERARVDALQKAADAFRRGHFSVVADLLSPYEHSLEGSVAVKLKLARKKLSSSAG